MSKELFGEPYSVETRNKKQEEKCKLNLKNWEGNLLILGMGAWKTLPPALHQPPPSPRAKKSGIGVMLSQKQLMSKQFYTEFREKETRSFQLVQCNTEFRKKQDPLRIFLSCKLAYYKDIQIFYN